MSRIVSFGQCPVGRFVVHATTDSARSMSGVNLDSFIRKITYQEITREGIAQLGKTIVTMAKAEGLDAHANAAALRMK